MVGFDEHHSTIDWKSPVRKSSEKTLSRVIWREVMRERHVKFLGLVNERALRTLSGGHPYSCILSWLASFDSNRKGELAMLHARFK